MALEEYLAIKIKIFRSQGATITVRRTAGCYFGRKSLNVFDFNVEEIKNNVFNQILSTFHWLKDVEKFE